MPTVNGLKVFFCISINMHKSKDTATRPMQQIIHRIGLVVVPFSISQQLFNLIMPKSTFGYNIMLIML